MDTKHFKDSEFACKCCGWVNPNSELKAVLELVRCKFDSPVIVNSACRCESHNAKVGGANNSRHKLGVAADIVVKGVPPKVVYGYLNSTFPNQYGIGKYDTFTHIDVRSKKARW